MVFKLLMASGIVFAGLGSPSAEESKTYWVVENTAPVRTQPKPQAPIKFNLRIGARIYAEKESEGWLYHKNHNSPEFSGWVQAASVIESEVDSAYIIRQIAQAKTFADSLRWCERMVAFKPGNKAYLKALQKGYTAAGDTARAAHYGRELRGANPVYLAQYDGEALRVIGSIDSMGNFLTLLWRETPDRSGDSEPPKYTPVDDTSKAIRKKALGLRPALAAMDWRKMGDHSWPGFQVDPFIWSSDKFKGAYEDLEGTATFGLTLGFGRDQYGLVRKEQVFATKPMYEVPVSGIRRATVSDSLAWYGKKLAGAAFDTVGMNDIHFESLDEYGFVDIRVGGVVGNRHGRGEARGIFDKGRNLVWPPEYTTGDDLHKDELVLKPAPRWFRFGPDAGSPAFIILPFTTNYAPPDFHEGNGSFGYHLLRVSKSGFQSFIIRSDYAGD
jgi:hypothetical protein